MQYIFKYLSKTINILFITLSIFAIYGCGSDSKTEEKKPPVVQPEPIPDPEPEPDPEPVEITITGSAVKGPLAFADVKVYAIDSTQTNFVGVTVGTGNTDAASQIENLSLPFPISPPYILEISAVEDTIDITTGQYPVIEVMKTLLTDEMLSGGKQVFATPLTDMTVSLIFKNADSNVLPYTGNLDGTTTNAEILAAIAPAQEQVKSTLGFGLEDNVDLFNTPPLINEDTNSADEQASTAAYRSAVEALTAVVYEIKQLSGDSDVSTDNILDDLAADLSDGVIDGTADGVVTESYPENALEILEQDPSTLPIPNDPDGRTVADVKELIIAETVQTGNTATDTAAFVASEEVIVLAPAELSPDIDGDGVFNSLDAYPEDAAADSDFDNDGMPDVAYIVVDDLRTVVVDAERSDNDDDNDGVIDENDAFPFDASETTDTDSDGTGNNADTDDDNDTVLDTADDFPLDSTRSNAIDQDNDGWPVGQDSNDSDVNSPDITFVDTDGDGQADTGGLAPDSDDDNDGVIDLDDVFPLNASESSDLDFDTIGDNTDTDIDGDNVLNEDDLFPYDALESIDTDGDGIGNYRDEDDDGDSLKDETEALLGTDPLKSDTDGDGVFDNADALPLDSSERFDTDKDNIGNNSDNCPLIANTFQINSDNDAFGDACDTDDDNDGVLDDADDFPTDATKFNAVDADNDGWPTEQDSDDSNAAVPSDIFVDTDSDGLADSGGLTPDTDDDNDGVIDNDDAFPLDVNEWLDTDSDGLGNNHDLDDDNDQFLDVDEIAANSDPLDSTSTPADFDGDLIADVSDADIDNDGVLNAQDAFDYDASETLDTDGDGVGNNTDTDIDGDGVDNTNDAFPNDVNESVDTDGDGKGDNADTDLDGDGVNNATDAFPRDSSETTDTDGDGTGDNADEFPNDATEVVDTDGDGTGDNGDAFPSDPSEVADSDGDGTGDNADVFPNDATEITDTDGDGTGDNGDAFPSDPSETADSDADGTGDNADAFPNDATETTDTDGDGTGDVADNCPIDANEDQLDINGNGKGDICENELFEFSYTFLTGEVLTGVINGVVLADTDTVQINSFISVKFDNESFLSIENDEVRATLITDTPSMSFSGNVLDFWVCPAGFTAQFLGGGDCNFKNESGFLLTHSIEFAVDGWAAAGPGDSVNKPSEMGITTANWTLAPLDTDDDTVLDIDDNCPLIPNIDQADSDGNDIGDICDNYTFDLNGHWLIEQTYTQTGVNGQCQPEPVEADIIIATMSASQLHFVGHKDADVEDEGIYGIIKSDATFTFSDGTFIADDGVYEPSTDSFTFSFTEFDNEESCTEVGNIYATRITQVNEQTSMVGGVSWYEGDIEGNNGQISSVLFEKGDVTDGQLEVFYEYDTQLSQWTESNAGSSDKLVTDIGIVTGTDILTASGYVNTGETLILSNSEEILHLDFQEMNLDGYSITGILGDEFSSVISSDATFTAASKAFFTTITQQTDSYEFWCDDNWDAWFEANLECNNAIPIAWDPEFTPAETMADIINLSSNPLTDLIGGIWLGDNGQVNVQAYLVSDNGDIDGANFKAVIIENANSLWEPTKIAEAGLIIKSVGSNIVYSFIVPENVHVDLERDSDERYIFLVEDSETEPGLTIVRRGNYLPVGHIESALLFDATAKAEIEAAFNYVDTDFDNIPDSLDPDQDNDGVANEDDTFPLDVTEWSDLDGDGTGDNADIDRDGDGVNNDIDVAPDDADISVAQTFTSAELKAQYITLPLSHGDEPSFRLGVGAGTQYMFNAGLGDMVSGSGSTSFSYSIVNDELLMSVDAPVQSTTYLTPSDMADMGIVSQQAADDFINSNGNYQIEMLSTVNERRWLLAASDISTQTFWQTSVTDYSFVQVWEQEQLIGLGSNLVTIEYSGSLLLTDMSTLNATAFTETELIAGNWAMPSNLDEFSTDIQFRLAADMATLNADYSGSNTISGSTFTWSLDAGTLELFYPNGGYVRMTRYQDFAEIDEVLVETDNAGIKSSSYQMVAPFVNATLDPLINQFAQNSFSLTNPDAYDNEGNYDLTDVFGYRLQDNGVATRVWSGDGDFNFNDYGSGWDTWQLNWGDFGAAEMTAYMDGNGTWHSDCNPDDWECSPVRKRVWVPIQQVGNRVYVIEYEERNSEAWNYGADPVWYMQIAPRIQFYEVLDIGLDSDFDGTIDSLDDDMDNDGFTNDVDAFVLDANEWLDGDMDGIGDNADADLDNDGVANEDDAFPLDVTEWSDLDGDGTGDNADIDRDGDGVNNDIDVAPDDADISVAQTFTSAELKAQYITLPLSHGDEPSFRLGVGAGTQYMFNAGLGDMVSGSGSTSFSYSIVNDELLMSVDVPVQSTTYLTPLDMADMGIVSQQVADDFVNSNGNYQIEMLSTVNERRWILAASDISTQTFWQSSVTDYSFVQAWEQEQLIGLGSNLVTIEDSSSLLLTDMSTLNATAFTEAELIAGNWAMPSNLDEFSTDVQFRLAADMATLNADYSGSNTLSGSTFTWSLDAGTLELFYPNGGYVRMTRYQDFAEIDEVLVEADNAGIKSSSYQMVAPFGNATFGPLMNKFAQNSFSLTNPDAYDNESNFDLTDVFGYRLQDNGVATRVWSGDSDFNFNVYGSGWDTWQLNWGDLDSAVMTSYLDGAKNGAWHSNCDPSNLDCSEHRKRVWVPIQQVGNRVYVIEYEERNSEAWNYGADPVWYMEIAPRIQYYEVMDIGLDSDSDGINDTVDNDMDNDGFTNDVDAFVFDANEWLDSDGDLTGDNQDAFPFDANEQYDSDDDGVGDNADDFPYDPTQTIGTPVNGISFIDVELQNCVNDIGATFVEDITSLDCSNRNLSDISDISQLASLQDVNLVGNKNISDFSSLALISSLIHVDVFDTNFADSDFSAFAGHSTIERIALDSNLVTSIADAASMPNLRGLHLWTENIYDLSVLTGLANFNELAISVTQVVDFSIFTQLNLEHLWLNGELEPWQVDIILGYSNMQQLSLGWNSYLSNDLLSQFINNNPNLSTLGIENTLITDLSSLFVNGESWNELVIPLEYINVDNLAVLDGIDLGTQVQELMNKGVQVEGELAYGWLIADALAEINDAELKQCLLEHTQGMTVTGQLKSLDCDGRNIHDLWGLWVFDNLRTLILNNNPIMDLGGELDSMQFLQELHLHNALVADINTLWNNPELSYLGVSNLPLNDPEQVNNLSSNIFVDGVVQATVALSSITFNDVQLQQCVDDTLLINIRELTDLDCNAYGISDISDINQLTNLFNLNLSGNSGIVDLSPLTQLASLTVIRLTDLLISDGQMGNIANIMRLEDLDISNNDTLTDLGPLSNARQLRAVHLWGTNSYDLTPLTDMPMLHMVALDYAQLSNGVEIFTQMPALNGLYLNGDIPYVDFETLMTSVSLSNLGHRGNSLFDDTYWQLIISNQPNLNFLEITNVSVSGLTGIDTLLNLNHLGINNTQVNDIQLLIDLRNAQDVLFSNDVDQSRLSYVNIDAIPLTDANQKTTLEGLGVLVDGIPQ
ncbi:hypothetical protein CXF85_04345 [Colwellia sp. 75C3]|uniref:thrombospondin type 3 repeat-containing protein n=1 Tax=Colwellia sp. 75C3 TaxID=888425 RepID=UPI000C3331A2|nr:thrombospondin type 3 repeat-containing protein [Colwellia sp. 75C3]PKG86006.1 hypothetical protein CXF85_04345 [Colwellia sp. 75C3]